MALNKKRESLQIRSLLRQDGALELSLAKDLVPQPAAEEVVVRVDAAPINPSDLGLLLAVADWSHPTVTRNAEGPVVAGSVSPGALRAMAARVDHSMPVGNEGAGLVIEAGSSPAAQGLLGKTVAVLGGAMYSEYRCVPVNQCLTLMPGTTAAEGASSFVNPLTALGMIGTMQREGHKALVHTAAASNLGQMLNRVCLNDDIALINIVRTHGQEALLKSGGAQYVCRSDATSFVQDLTDALVATGATLAFDAIGGGPLAGQILTCMEMALNRGATTYSRYGSATHKQVYLYGTLDMAPTVLNRSYGMAWGMGGWLVTSYIQKIGAEALERMKQRVATEIKTTFASRYTAEISLLEALDPKIIAAYGRRATGGKYLVNPHKPHKAG
jgi:NADPH2:quinone reductase